MQSFYDAAAFHKNVDLNLNQLLQGCAETMTYDEMTVEQSNGRAKEGR